jgi:hypothetical protein
VNNPLHVNEDDKHALRLSPLFGLGEFGHSMYDSHFHP